MRTTNRCKWLARSIFLAATSGCCLIWQPSLGQEAPINQRHSLTDLTTKPTPLDLEIGPEAANLLTPGEGESRIWRSSDQIVLDTRIFGELVLEATKSFTVPGRISLIGNQVELGGEVKLFHRIDGENLPPYFEVNSRGEANILGLHKDPGANISANIALHGLLVNGLGEYMEKSGKLKKLEQAGWDASTTPDGGLSLGLANKITPDFRIGLERLNELARKAKDLNAQLTTFSEIQNPSENALRDVQAARTQYDNTLADIKSIQDQLLSSLSFQCAPEFQRIISFPIYERSVSTGRGRAAGNGSSASAAIGVSGDLGVEITDPMCAFRLLGPLSFEMRSSANVEILSHGFFGIRGDGRSSMSIGITYKDKNGEYPSSHKISAQERATFDKMSLGAVDLVYNSPEILQRVSEEIPSLIEGIPASIYQEIVGDDTDARRACANLRNLGLDQISSDIKGICSVAFSVLPAQPLEPTISLLPLPPAPQLPPRPDRDCRASLPKISPCRGALIADFPPGCKATNASIEATNNGYQRACQLMREWEQKIERINASYNQAKQAIEQQNSAEVDRVQAIYREQISQWQKQHDEWLKYSNSTFISGTIRDIVSIYVLKPVDAKKLAQLILDASWFVNEEVELVQLFVQEKVIDRLAALAAPISVKGSGRIAFSSTARLLQATPSLRMTGIFSGIETENPQLELDTSLSPDSRGKGVIGGLDITGYRIDFSIGASAAGRTFFNAQKKVEDSSPTIKTVPVDLKDIPRVDIRQTIRLAR